MKRLLCLAAAVMVLAATSDSAQAQRRDASLLGLLNNKAVAKEVGVLDEQADGLKELAGELQKKFPRPKVQGSFFDLTAKQRRELMTKFGKWRADMAKAAIPKIKEILFPPQLKRLEEIQVQALGINAIGNERVAKQLKLSKAQNGKAKKAMAAFSAKMGKIFQSAGGDRQKMTKLFAEANKEHAKTINGILTKDQKTALAKLKGKPFKFPARRRSRKKKR